MLPYIITLFSFGPTVYKPHCLPQQNSFSLIPKMSPKPGIPSFYYYFFLWVDPIMCFPGVYLYLFDHKTVLDRGIPHHLHQALLIPPSPTPSPLTSYLLTLLGFFFLLIFTLQITLMRRSLNYPSHITISIWRMFMLAILVVDFG